MAQEKREPKDAAPPVEPAPPPGLLRRLLTVPTWLRLSPLRAALAAGAVVAIIGVAVGLTLAFRPAARPAYLRQLGEALARFDAGDRREARRIAAELLTDTSVGYSDHGGAYFILGAITLREADEQINPTKRQLLDLVAARYLEEAHNRGTPQNRKAECRWLLGRALHDAGRYARSVSILREALEGQSPNTPQIQALLADCYLSLQPPRLAEALERNRLYLETPGLSPGELDAGRLVETRALLALHDLAAAAASVAQIQPASPAYAQAVILRGRILLETLQQAAAASPAVAPPGTAATIEQLQSLANREGSVPAAAAQAQLLIGLLLQQQGDTDGARQQFDRTRRGFFGQPEALAATVFQADLMRRASPEEAVVLYKRALLQAGPADAYDNAWLSAEQLQTRLEAAIDDLADRGEFAKAVELAEGLVPLFARPISIERQANIERAWATQLALRAVKEKPQDAAVTEAEARQHWRQAGVLGRQLADLRIATRFYLDGLAHAADDLRRGQGYQQAAKVYHDLLRQEPREGEPEALVGLGETLQALGRIDEALVPLTRCREVYPTHPATYRARLLASQALQDQGKLPEAQELLIDNLYHYSLAPLSSDWRDSLFALGNLYYRQGMDLESKSRVAGVDRPDAETRRAGLALLEQAHAAFDEAIRTLSEAVKRYANDPQAIEASYRIAEAHRHSAKLPRKRLGGATIETSRALLTRQMQEHLQAAIDEYNKLITHFSDQQEAQRWPTELAILRNSYFGRADSLFDLARYEEAIGAYSAATNRYQHDPESLEAYVQIASCYRRLGRMNDARGTLDQARVVLSRIRPDADFLKTTRLARQDWVQLIDWLHTL